LPGSVVLLYAAVVSLISGTGKGPHFDQHRKHWGNVQLEDPGPRSLGVLCFHLPVQGEDRNEMLLTEEVAQNCILNALSKATRRIIICAPTLGTLTNVIPAADPETTLREQLERVSLDGTIDATIILADPEYDECHTWRPDDGWEEAHRASINMILEMGFPRIYLSHYPFYHGTYLFDDTLFIVDHFLMQRTLQGTLVMREHIQEGDANRRASWSQRFLEEVECIKASSRELPLNIDKHLRELFDRCDAASAEECRIGCAADLIRGLSQICLLPITSACAYAKITCASDGEEWFSHCTLFEHACNVLAMTYGGTIIPTSLSVDLPYGSRGACRRVKEHEVQCHAIEQVSSLSANASTIAECVPIRQDEAWVWLYHGSNEMAIHSILSNGYAHTSRPLDFNRGFYFSDTLQSAIQRANQSLWNGQTTRPAVLAICLPHDWLAALRVHSFPVADGSWKEFVRLNRTPLPSGFMADENDDRLLHWLRMHGSSTAPDVVIGPIATNFRPSLDSGLITDKRTDMSSHGDVWQYALRSRQAEQLVLTYSKHVIILSRLPLRSNR